MLQLPFEIPKSQASYAEHFDKHPEKATQRLKKQLDKRGPDAVGYFLLSWFYHLQDRNDEAIDEALKAQTFAPGSPFFKKLHYYLSHPDIFEAWIPEKDTVLSQPSSSTLNRPNPILDLDSLIQKLSTTEAQRIRPDSNMLDDSGSSSTDVSRNVDDIVSETLAKIHEQQGKLDTAIKSYRQLKRIKSDKSDYFDEQIERLKNLKEKSDKN